MALKNLCDAGACCERIRLSCGLKCYTFTYGLDLQSCQNVAPAGFVTVVKEVEVLKSGELLPGREAAVTVACL
jgi:hypothetical protein